MNYTYADKIISAGKMQNEISLDEILTDTKRNIFDLISLLQFKTAVFDFDGTLDEFKYTNTNRLLPCKDDEIATYEGDFYKDARMLKTMQYILNECNPNDVYIVTVSENSVIEAKNKKIYSTFPYLEKNHIFHVKNSSEKLDILKMLYEQKKKKIIFCEDTAKTLLNAEEAFDYVQGYHISSLIA